jgi:hypothetical protein
LTVPGHYSPLDANLTPMFVVVISGIQAVFLMIINKDLFAFFSHLQLFLQGQTSHL